MNHVWGKFLLGFLYLFLSGCGSATDTKEEKNSAPATTSSNATKPKKKELVIQGHTLPPEPDPKVNYATLLGVDANGNGVRDDVERWIYVTYKDKHPIYIEIAMQAARGYRLVLEHPEKAKEIHDEVSAALYCQGYYKMYAKYFHQSILLDERVDDKVFNKYFNTNIRKEIYWQYDTLLSGGTYTLPKIGEGKKYCDFNISLYDNTIAKTSPSFPMNQREIGDLGNVIMN